jgi:selenocysteine lyase/cysteine desulfurase
VVTDALHWEGSLYLYQSLQKQGLDLRIVMPRDWRIRLADLEKVIDRKTRLVALSLVAANTGFRHDLKAVCELAHSRGAYVYADVVQAAGAIPFDVRASGIDFCACSSYKWLMGDMGLGFLYVREDLLDRVVRRVQYGYRQLRGWQEHIYPYNPPADTPLTWQQAAGAGAYFEVGTISNTTVACLSHSLAYIQKLGVERIQAHAQSMIQRLQKELPRMGFKSLTPADAGSPIATFVVEDPAAAGARLEKANVSVRLSGHLMRVSPSVYNDQADIDKLLNALS